jgi:hypothetical protein
MPLSLTVSLKRWSLFLGPQTARQASLTKSEDQDVRSPPGS